MRVVRWLVQPVIMADDGEELTEVQVNPLVIAAREWEAWTAGGYQASLDQLRAQVEGPPAPAPAGPADVPSGDMPQDSTA